MKITWPWSSYEKRLKQHKKDQRSIRRRDRENLRTRDRKLPFKQYPLPQAAESLQDRLQTEAMDNILIWYLATVCSALCTFGAILQVSREDTIILTIITAGIFGIAIIKTKKWLPELRNIRLGIYGEKLVAEYLDNPFRDLIDGKVRILHDVPHGTGNYDHIIICSKGIFIINTKIHTLPDNELTARTGNVMVFKHGELWYDYGEKLIKKSFNPFPQIINQVKRLQRTLELKNHKLNAIYGIITFPGWQIKHTDMKQKTIALGPTYIAPFINAWPDTLSDHNIIEITNSLNEMIREPTTN